MQLLNKINNAVTYLADGFFFFLSLFLKVGDRSGTVSFGDDRSGNARKPKARATGAAPFRKRARETGEVAPTGARLETTRLPPGSENMQLLGNN